MASAWPRGERYARVAIVFHWTVAALVIVNIGRGKDPEYGRGPRYSYDDATLTL